MRLELVVPCLFGLESLVAREIRDLGYETTSVVDGRVSFMGDETAVIRANLWVRYGERVLIKVGEFPAATFDQLYEGTKALPWENFIEKQDAFPVAGHALKSKLFSIPDCQRIIKKAVVDRLQQRYQVSWFQETGVKYQISFLIMKDNASLMIDTTGDGLHKRGYRAQSNLAPMRETLAAAIVNLSRYRAGRLLWDPMCGSGTIPIEAAMIGRNMAPGLQRSFACEPFPFLTDEMFRIEREKAVEAIRKEPFSITASDIDPECTALTLQNAKLAGVSQNLSVRCMDARDVSSDMERGILICNPPWGERLLEVGQSETLYEEMGQAFLALKGWSYYILSYNKDFERLFGKKCDKKRKLYNGMKQCELFQYFK